VAELVAHAAPVTITEQGILARQRHYWGLAAALVVIALITPLTPWYLSTGGHRVLEVIATTVAFMVGCLALVRHFSRRSGRFLFIGVGFLGTAFFDALHAIASQADVAQELPSSFGSVTFWSWLASRVFLSMLLVLAALRIQVAQYEPQREVVQEWKIFVAVGALLLFCLVLFWRAPLPDLVVQDALLGRPLELIPAMLFLLAFGILYRSKAWQFTYFVHWLMLALLVSFAIDGLLLVFSDQLFDNQSLVAHWFKIASYALVFAGLAHSLFELLRDAEAAASALGTTNQMLEQQIEERRQAEAQLRTSELRLADAQRLARMGYWDMNLQTQQVNLSAELSAILGLPVHSNTLALAELFEWVTANDRPVLAQALDRATQTLTPFDIEVAIAQPGVEPIHLYLLGNTIGDSEGKAARLWGTGQDVTERHRTEEQLRTSAAQLEASNRELQDFAYIASHDLQEPLRKIIAFSDRLSFKYRAALDETGLDYLHRVQHAARRMQVLIEDLLSLSRVTTRGQPFVTVDLDETVREVASDLETRLEETGGHLEIGPLPTVEADPLQMRQLFQNLIGNALKFHRQGVAPVVRVYQEQEAEDMANPAIVTIVVEDNGIGFDMKYADRIFQPFQRLHGRSSDYAGTGMGLAICRKIMDRHQGQIEAVGIPEAGAKFLVSLPRIQWV
jgi:signal transduction histidine kinase